MIDVECPRCNGNGEVVGGNPNTRARYVRYDDLDTGDFGEICPKCAGSGNVAYDPNDELEEWMDPCR